MPPIDADARRQPPVRSGSRAMRVFALAAMPLLPASALTIAVLAVALTLAAKVGMFGVPLIAVLLTWLFKYSFAFLDELVAGADSPPVLSVEMLTSSARETRALLPLVVVIIVFLASGASAFWVGPAVTAAAGVLTIAVLPAVIAVQGWTGSARQSLSIAACLRLVRLLGTDYAWAVLCVGLIATTCLLCLYALPLLPCIAALICGWLALIAVSGGLVHAHRDAIVADTEFFALAEPPTAAQETTREQERIVDAIYGEWRSGAHENAWRTLVRHADGSADPLQELRRLYRRVSAWEGPSFANRVARELISRLLAVDREGEALALARERLRIDARFRPRHAAELVRLARIARDAADRPAAHALLQDFAGHYPDDPQQAAADQLLETLRRR